MPLRGLILICIFALSIPVCFVRPFYGIILWTVVAFLNPQSYVWSAGTAFPWALAVAIPVMIGLPIFTNGLKNLNSPRVILIGALWLWFTLTSMISTSTPLFMHHAVDTWYRWGFVSKILLMTVVTIAVVESFAQLRILVLVIAGSFGIFVAKAAPFMILSGGAFRIFGPPNSMVADNNDFGLALNMTLPIFFFLAQTEEHRWVRWIFGILCLITVPAIFFTYSRGALVGLIAVSSLMFLQSRQRIVLVPVIVLGILVALLFAPQSWRDRMDPTRPDAIDASARERLNAWAFARNLATEYPIAGGGFATFTPELFARYAPVAMDYHGSHSVYFGLLAEHGYVGLTLYLTLVASCFVGAHRLVKEARCYNDWVVVNYTNMFRFSLVGFLTSGMFLGRAYFDYFFTIVACLAVLTRVAREHWASFGLMATDAVEEASGEEVFLDRGIVL
jgi:probable O-glycosylation ligase (exosortase A-associated)